jgi:hypothetical protein
VGFPEQNGTLRGAPGHLGTDGEQVSDLPVCRDGHQVVSCWRLSWADRLRALVTGRAWLLVLTPLTHAPVCVTADRPFKEP